jgi:signal transduction histidine kinase
MWQAGRVWFNRLVVTTRFAGLQRQRHGRLVAGVCSGIASRTRLDVSVIRFAVMLLSMAGGAGVIAYGVAWSVLPLVEPDDDEARARPHRSNDAAERIAVVLLAIGATLVLRSMGLWFSDMIGVVGAVAASGVALVWGGASDAGELGGQRPLRIAVGLLLMAAGVATLLLLSGDVATMGRTLVSAGLAAAGVALLLGPNLARLGDELGEERRARIRIEERAEIAAHLHDGVLQTLAMIQRRADDPRQVATLARRQERELREWLHGGISTGAASMAGLLKAELADVEDAHGIRVELVCVGDAPIGDGVNALVAATREAALNAARHARVERVDVYVEVEDEQIAAFVRDRGSGFDPATVDPMRRGLAESIVGRMRRAGGSADVRSQPGEGTEVRLFLPFSGDRGKVTS